MLGFSASKLLIAAFNLDSFLPAMMTLAPFKARPFVVSYPIPALWSVNEAGQLTSTWKNLLSAGDERNFALQVWHLARRVPFGSHSGLSVNRLGDRVMNVLESEDW